MSVAVDQQLLHYLASLPDDDFDQSVQDISLLIKFGTPDAVHQRCKDDAWEFAKVFFEPMLSDPKTELVYTPADFHDELYALSRDVILRRGPFAKNRGLVAGAPRGMGKSTIISLIIAIWAIVYEHKRFIVIFSDTGDQAEVIGSNIRREFEDNEVLRFYFGDLSGARFKLKWTLRDFTIVKTDKRGRRTYVGRIKVRGTGASIRGIRERQYRPDLIIGDDMENDEDVENKEIRDKLYESWWSSAVLKMLDPLYGSVIVVGTKIHFDSLLSKLLTLGERFGTYVTRLWTCYNSDGESVWEERFPTEALKAMQEENPVAFAKEMLNDPRPSRTRLFRAETIKFYSAEEVEYDGYGNWSFRGQPLTIFSAVDPAISEEDEACLFAIVTCGLLPDRQTIVVLSVKLDKLDFPSQVEACLQENRLFRPTFFGFETNAYQRALPQMTRRKLRGGERMAVKQLQHGQSKIRKRQRITALSPLIREGRIWFRSAQEGEAGYEDELGRVRVHHTQYELYDELMKYPLAIYDDGPDALASCVETMGENLLFAPNSWSDVRTLQDAKPLVGFEALQQPLYQQILGHFIDNERVA